MNKNRKFSVGDRLQSFKYAFRGIGAVFAQEHNMIIHFLATIVVIVLCFIFPVSRIEIIAIVLSTGFVWVAEIFNTVIEKIMDFISPQIDPRVKRIKDMSAAAVLLAAVAALVAGCIIFIPKFS
jgi:diacylglycerol kinase (ATP)